MAYTYLEGTNLAETTLAAGISDSATSISVATGEGAKFPTGKQTLLLTDGTNFEIVLVDSRSGDTFTVNSSGRGYGETTAQAWASADTVQGKITWQHILEIQTVRQDALLGEIKEGLFTSIEPGWLAMNGDTVGNTGSGATHTGAVYEAFFNHIKQFAPNAGTESFAGLQTVTIPDARGRVLVGAGQGSGLTDRAQGSTFGAETHQLSEAELPSHRHEIQAGENAAAFASIGNYPGYEASETAAIFDTVTAGVMASDVITLTGSDSAHNNMPPSLAVTRIIKY